MHARCSTNRGATEHGRERPKGTEHVHIQRGEDGGAVSRSNELVSKNKPCHGVLGQQREGQKEECCERLYSMPLACGGRPDRGTGSGEVNGVKWG
jgi:hypothetical protein